MQHLAFIQQMHSRLETAGEDPHAWEIRSLQSIGSTNTRVGDMLGLYDRVIILSETQSKGRGRGQNVWYSPLGGLWLSFGFLCNAEVTELSSPVITRLQSLLSSYVECQVKEPNDLLVDGKKLSGILVETKITSNKMRQVIVGIGINITNDIPDEVKDIATRLADHSEEVPKIHDLAAKIVVTLIEELRAFIPEL